MSGILISGTDTGVGKTLVGCGIAGALTLMGETVGVFKPVETGCALRNGQLVPDDASLLAHYAHSDLSMDQICPYRYRTPVAPSVAAKLEQRPIRVDRLRTLFTHHTRAHRRVLVEGAGGLLVPIAPGYTFADLALDLKIPCLIVIGSKLGALNHAALTLHCLATRSIPVLGYVLNHTSPASDDAIRTNAQALSELTDVPCLGILPFLNLCGEIETDRSVVVDAARRHLDLHPLLEQSNSDPKVASRGTHP